MSEDEKRGMIIEEKKLTDAIRAYAEKLVKEMVKKPTVTREDIDSFIRLFVSYRGEERQQAIDVGVEWFEKKGFKVKG